MRVYGLYGESGSGKSHRASEVMALLSIDALIDDGILIVNKVRVAGQSAKNEQSALAATRIAILFSELHRQEILRSIRNLKLHSILIVGTSRKMIHTIANRLDVSQEIQWISIDSLQSPDELLMAKEARGLGYHVIPIHPMEVKSTYYGQWYRTLIVFFGKRRAEVTLVRPHYLKQQLFKGKIIIESKCIRDIISNFTKDHLKIHDVKIDQFQDQVFVSVSTPLGLSVRDLHAWRDQLNRILDHTLGKHYVINLKWRSIIWAERRIGS